MRRLPIFCLLFVAGIGCHNDGPTAPATAAPIDLNGVWTARVTFADSVCAATETLTATVTQISNYVTIYVATQCHGPTQFSGTFSHGEISGAINHHCYDLGDNDPYFGPPSVLAPTSGSVDGKHIILDAVTASNGACSLPGVKIDLSR